jgi:hypothetical protein
VPAGFTVTGIYGDSAFNRPCASSQKSWYWPVSTGVVIPGRLQHVTQVKMAARMATPILRFTGDLLA